MAASVCQRVSLGTCWNTVSSRTASQQQIFPLNTCTFTPLAASCSPFCNDFKTYVDQACRAADEFVNIYYETMDKRRRALTRLYLDKATLIWNGNAVSGQEELNKFFEMLPSSEFQVNVLDCQPVHEQATQGQTTVLVVTSGTVKFDGDKQRYFNQNFLLTAQATPTNTVWKIASDCFRFQDWAS